MSLVALVVVVLVAAGFAMTLAVRSFLVEQLDRELVSTATNLARSPTPSEAGLRDRTVVVETDTNGQVIHPPIIVQGNGDHDSDSDDQQPGGGNTNSAGLSSDDLIALSGATGPPSTVQLSGLGSYRVVQVNDIAGHRVTVGLPLDQVDETLGRLLVIAVVTLAAAALVVAVGGGWLIRRELIPLDRVAGTARRVASLPLDSGTPRLDERVPDATPGTEIGDVAEAMNEMLDHLDASLETRAETERQLRQFVADASHELRTPLASIRGYSELYRRHDVSDVDRQTAMSRIESEADRMATLVDDLLLLARLDQGRPLLHEPVDLSRLAAEAAADMTVAHPSHPITVKLPTEPAFALGDEDRLRQVLANLLTNAIQHTPEATPVEVSVVLVGDRVRLSVVDQGPGITAQFQAHAFERFSRADESRARASGGSGLGLSIVFAVVEALNGQVTLESGPGRTQLLVDLPNAQPAHSDSQG
ncbi:MAG TPA: HAMP domain-containing sensor histidine kinase [Actinomycetes bacterium]|nr:HAMP domain-containing sensor histidine kinase [Actinomycetes bacterium]